MTKHQIIAAEREYKKVKRDYKEVIKLAKRFYPYMKGMCSAIYEDKFVLTPEWENLHLARHICKKVLGSWNDKFYSINNPYSNLVMIRYKSEKYPLVYIWAKTTIENTPKQFTKNGCKWEVMMKGTQTLICPPR